MKSGFRSRKCVVHCYHENLDACSLTETQMHLFKKMYVQMTSEISRNMHDVKVLMRSLLALICCHEISRMALEPSCDLR